jgi:molybdopterin-biosynthesis enzyme MoeA-like protein
MEAIFAKTIAPLLKEAVGDRIFCEKSLFVDGIFESGLAPLIDKVMGENAGIHIKSHVCTRPHSVPAKDKPHIEIHLTTSAKCAEKSLQKIQKAMKELADWVDAYCGKASIKN